MSMTDVVEESLKADARFRHLTVMPMCSRGYYDVRRGFENLILGFDKLAILFEAENDRRRQDQA